MGSGILNRIPIGSRIALDKVPFVYFLKRHPTYYHPAKDLFERIEKGKIEAVASTLVLTELLVPAFRAKDLSRAKDVLRLLAHFPHLKLIEVTVTIAYEASRIRVKSSLRTLDALHLATALMQKADCFVTNDKAFTRIPDLPLKIGLFSASCFRTTSKYPRPKGGASTFVLVKSARIRNRLRPSAAIEMWF